MDYAVVLYFDEETELYFNRISSAIEGSDISNYKPKVFPHITIADFHTEKISTIISAIEHNISIFEAGDVTWASLGSFVPSVLFAAPVFNEYLLNSCTSINNLIKPFAPHCGYGHYLPFQWVPHTTLASRLDSDSLRNAFNAASQIFTTTTGKCTKLSIVQCSPIKEIKTWHLT